MMKILDGKITSQSIQDEISIEVLDIVRKGKRAPHLCAVLVGNDGASETYVNAKVRACERVGFKSTLIRLEDDVSQSKLILEINQINDNPDVDGIIVQLPLPNHIDEMEITKSIDPRKDVDGFHPSNIGRMSLDLPTYLPATPSGIR